MCAPRLHLRHTHFTSGTLTSRPTHPLHVRHTHFTSDTPTSRPAHLLHVRHTQYFTSGTPTSRPTHPLHVRHTQYFTSDTPTSRPTHPVLHVRQPFDGVPFCTFKPVSECLVQTFKPVSECLVHTFITKSSPQTPADLSRFRVPIPSRAMSPRDTLLLSLSQSSRQLFPLNCELKDDGSVSNGFFLSTIVENCFFLSRPTVYLPETSTAAFSLPTDPDTTSKLPF